MHTQRAPITRETASPHPAGAGSTAEVVRLPGATITPLPQPRQRAILVLGMSRSGTSLVTRLCSLAGAALPAGLMRSGFGNPLGHWEPSSLVALNEGILAALDRRWDDPRPIPDAWFRSRHAHSFMPSVCEAIRQCCGAAGLSVLKDPRITRLLPLYLDALDTLDIEPLILVQVRPPLEVIRSLVDRDGIDPSTAELLWVRSIAEAEAHTRDCPRAWVDARAAIEDWQGTLGRIARTFHLTWPNTPDQMRGEVDRFLKPRLLHQAAEPAARSPGLGLLAGLAWCAVTDALRGESVAAAEEFEVLHRLLSDVDRLQQGYIDALAADRRRLHSILASRSWRATTPLRLLGSLARGIRGR